jgi:hypothetical protein
MEDWSNYPGFSYDDSSSSTFDSSNFGSATSGGGNPSASKICKAAIIADASFYNSHGQYAAGKMVSHLSQVSSMMEAQLGTTFEIVYQYVCDSGYDSTGLCASPNDSGQVVPYINQKLADIEELKSIDLCIVALFSSNELTGGAVGVSYVGTACQLGGTGLIVQDKGGSMSNAELSATLMHEIGHSFGSNHDDPGSECAGNENSRYVMYPTVQESVTMMQFSSCSLNSIVQNLAKPEAQCMAGESRSRSSFRPKKVENPKISICAH